MLAVLISTYELGHQPFGLSSPAAWLSAAGAEVKCMDLAVDKLDEGTVSAADVVAFYLPMHTATRLATRVIERVRTLNPRARIAAYGLYAPMNADLLRALGVGLVDHVHEVFGEPRWAIQRNTKTAGTDMVRHDSILQLRHYKSLDLLRALAPRRGVWRGKGPSSCGGWPVLSGEACHVKRTAVPAWQR